MMFKKDKSEAIDITKLKNNAQLINEKLIELNDYVIKQNAIILRSSSYSFDDKIFSPESRMLISLIEERKSAISILKTLCEEFGDLDWDENSHLYDIIEKHFAKPLWKKYRNDK